MSNTKYIKEYKIFSPRGYIKVKACDYTITIDNEELKCFYWFNFDRFSLHELYSGMIIDEYSTLTELRAKATKQLKKKLIETKQTIPLLVQALKQMGIINQ